MFGIVEIFMFVSVADRMKRVTLVKIPCNHHEAGDKLFEFRQANERICGADIHAEFKFTEFVG